MEVPAKAVLQARTLGHEILAMVDEEPNLALCALQASARKLGLAQEGTSDRERIDRVGLATAASSPARTGHPPRRHPHDALAARKQEALESPGDVTAVLEGEDALRGERACPGHKLTVACVARSAGVLGDELPGRS